MESREVQARTWDQSCQSGDEVEGFQHHVGRLIPERPLVAVHHPAMVIDREAFGRDWRVGDVTTQPFQFAALVILRASNSGKGHVRLNSASLMGPNGQFLEKRGMAEFILPRGVRTWEFAPEAAAGPWQLIADTNEGPIRVSLELGPDQSTATAADVGQ